MKPSNHQTSECELNVGFLYVNNFSIKCIAYIDAAVAYLHFSTVFEKQKTSLTMPHNLRWRHIVLLTVGVYSSNHGVLDTIEISLTRRLQKAQVYLSVYNANKNVYSLIKSKGQSELNSTQVSLTKGRALYDGSDWLKASVPDVWQYTRTPDKVIALTHIHIHALTLISYIYMI